MFEIHPLSSRGLPGARTYEINFSPPPSLRLLTNTLHV
jgi:hypothetical protein